MKTIIVYLLLLLPPSVFAQSVTEKLDAYLTAAEAGVDRIDILNIRHIKDQLTVGRKT